MEVDKVDIGEGNTILPQKQCRRWCFTLNSYDVDKLDTLYTTLRSESLKGIVGQEVGGGGTKHLQGYLEFKNGRQMLGVKKLFAPQQPHLEIAHGNASSNRDYCSKEGNFVEWGAWPERIADPMVGLTLKPWQKEIIDMLSQSADSRSIHWYWDKHGGIGKTTLAKHMALKHNALIVSGKASDVKCAIAQMDVKPKVVVFCCPRNSEGYISYDALEQVKDGLFFSGKYESGMVVFNCPHVIVFANFPPDQTKLSGDRWRVVNIEENDDIF